MAIPPDMAQVDPGSSLIAQLPVDMELGRITLEVTASPPSVLLEQPAAGQPVQGWLEGYIARLTPAPGSATRGPTSTREVTLPAGPGLELRTSFFAAGPEDDVILYAIDTGSGFGLLQLIGQRSIMESRADDIRLIMLLLEFGPADD